MSSNNKDVLSLLLLSSVSLVIPLFMSYIFSFGFEPLVLILPLSYLVVSFAFLCMRKKQKIRGRVLFVLSLCLAFFSSFVFSLLVHASTPFHGALFALRTELPLLALVPIIFSGEKRKKSSFVFIAVLWIIMYSAIREYSVSYTYLYEGYFDYEASYAVLTLISILLAGGNLSLYIFDTERNYLNYSVILVSAFLMGYEEMIELNLPLSFKNLLIGTGTAVFFWALIINLIMYVKWERKEKSRYEKRNIVFSDMVYEEVRTVKKKPRKAVFEIPPNVPRFKRDLTQNSDSVNKNNAYND